MGPELSLQAGQGVPWSVKTKKQENVICDALCDLILFVQFKKLGKHLWRSVIFSKVACFLQMVLNCAKYHICYHYSCFLTFMFLSQCHIHAHLHSLMRYIISIY